MKRLLALVMPLGMVLATPANAQRQLDEDYELDPLVSTGSHIPIEVETLEQGEARRMQKDVGRCVYARNEDLSVQYLRKSNFFQIDYDGFGHQSDEIPELFDMSHCLSRAMRNNQRRTLMRFDMSILRTMLAEEAYLDRHNRPIAATELGEKSLNSRYLVPQYSSVGVNMVADYADCMVFHAPAQTDYLLRTHPASSNETEAIDALQSTMRQCGLQNGQIELSPTTIRALVADGLWSRSENVLLDTVALGAVE